MANDGAPGLIRRDVGETLSLMLSIHLEKETAAIPPTFSDLVDAYIMREGKIAGVAELVFARLSKCRGRKPMRVRLPPPAPPTTRTIPLVANRDTIWDRRYLKLERNSNSLY